MSAEGSHTWLDVRLLRTYHGLFFKGGETLWTLQSVYYLPLYLLVEGSDRGICMYDVRVRKSPNFYGWVDMGEKYNFSGLVIKYSIFLLLFNINQPSDILGCEPLKWLNVYNSSIRTSEPLLTFDGPSRFPPLHCKKSLAIFPSPAEMSLPNSRTGKSITYFLQCWTNHWLRWSRCSVSAASIIEAMDITVDPCTDFFTFSCGGWIEKVTLWSLCSLFSHIKKGIFLNNFRLGDKISSF